ncbi:MAG: VOC family protein [Alphaproteobacteria bacterium]|jgi:catechol 2,3-dioxygenase-like lactoylglutathione lyase family enzyme|nr:VOC family protein [Alphaproteobacteria bacterium]
MPDFKVLGTNHTSFTVSDLDRSIAFFEDGLGFEVTSKGPRDPKAIEQIVGVPGADILVAYIRGPGHSIELIQYLAPDDRGRVSSRPCDVGFAHMAFDVDDLDAALAAAARHEVKPIGSPYTIDKGPNTGNRIVYLRDADGVTIEFIEKPGA